MDTYLIFWIISDTDTSYSQQIAISVIDFVFWGYLYFGHFVLSFCLLFCLFLTINRGLTLEIRARLKLHNGIWLHTRHKGHSVMDLRIVTSKTLLKSFSRMHIAHGVSFFHNKDELVIFLMKLNKTCLISYTPWAS